MATPDVDRDLVLEHLNKVLFSESFRRAERASALLRYIVERAVEGKSDGLKEYTLGVEALGRGDAFDPRSDPIVRAEASRLRTRLERYYETEGRADALGILLPKGSYVPQFVPRAPADDTAPRSEPATAAPAERPTVWRPGWVALAAFVAAGALLAVGWSLPRLRAQVDAPLLRFDVELRSNGTLGSEVGTDLVFTPDGARVVFVTRDARGLARLNVRRLDAAEAVELPETEGARSPFVSADGRWVGFWGAGRLKKVPIDGGAPVVLCDATDVFGASWGEDDTIIAALNPTGRLWRVPAAGGSPEALLDLSSDLAFPSWPQLLPGARDMIYTVMDGRGADRATIEARAVRGGERKVLVRGGTYGRYVAGGFLTYVNQGTLYAVRFDAERLEVTGRPVPVAEDVSYSRTFGYAQMDVSPAGTLVYRRGAEGERFVVEWLDRSGNATPLLGTPGRYDWLRLSPDGRSIAFASVESGGTSIWVYTAGGDGPRRVTGPAAAYSSPMWWPDGRMLLIGGKVGLAWTRADGAAEPGVLTSGNVVQVPWSFTPDRTRLVGHEMRPGTGFDAWTAPVQITGAGVELGARETVLQSPAFECYPSYSPDGRWLAYTSNETGAWEVYVQPAHGGGPAVRVSTAGGTLPIWSPNGRELFYRTWDQHLLVTTYRAADGAFVADAPRAWSPRTLGDTGVLANFDVAPDGERVAALMPVASARDRQSPNHATFLLNFAAEVRRRASPSP